MATVQEQVTEVFERLLTGETSPFGPELQSGWEMTLPSGATVTRSSLQWEAAPLISLGRDSVPYLLAWAENEDLAIRYIAVYALGQITGLEPHVPHFAHGDEQGYLSRAIDAWRRWYEDSPEQDHE